MLSGITFRINLRIFVSRNVLKSKRGAVDIHRFVIQSYIFTATCTLSTANTQQ